MRGQTLISICQLSSILRKMPSSQTPFFRWIHKTDADISGSAAFKTYSKEISMKKAFPSKHESLTINFIDNLTSDFQYIWLRDNCPCEKCVHPRNKQKLLDTVSLDINIKPLSYHITENGKLKVTWPEIGGNRHVSCYDPEWLYEYGIGFKLDTIDAIHSDLPPMITWDSQQINKIKPEITYQEVIATDEGLRKWLDLMYKYGIVIIKNVPCNKGEVIKVVERVAYLKTTKWGSSFDVLCQPVQNDPNHLAFSGMYLEHHTDMNYLEKSPGLQALHCLEASSPDNASGGSSFFVDGFYIGKWLQDNHPSSYHTLTTTLVEFKIHSHNMEYRNHQYVLSASKTGNLQEVHYNTRTMAPLKGPADVKPFYQAYMLMGQKMRELGSQLFLNLKPGDLVAFNNRRILHGRTSFDPAKMSRHLEGCYGDFDEVVTRYRSLLKADKCNNPENKFQV